MKTFLLMLSAVLLIRPDYAAGVWTQLATVGPHTYGGQMNLLSDGTVVAKTTSGGTSVGSIWDRLTPDIHGSYVNGTWSTTIPAMHDTRTDFSSQILKDGRLYVAGGEYGTGSSAAEVYDPLTNLWTEAPAPGSLVSDACSEILPDGRVLQSLVGTRTTIVIYDPATNTYSAGPSTKGPFAEAAWVKLKDNSILQVDYNSTASERYIPSLNSWVVDGKVPVNLYDPYGGETGAGFLLPDGRAFFLGSTGTTAIYSPTGTTSPGTWVAGPAIPDSQGTPDAPAAMMVNGKILCSVSPIPTSADHFPTPISFYEYDYLTNTFTRVSAPGGGMTRNTSTYDGNMLALPDGRVLYSEQGIKNYYVYTPDGVPLASGKPAIRNVTPNANGSYTITGTLFNGISEGAGYGDDEQMATNYPIIRLTSGTSVYYARTFDWNSTGVQRGSAPDTALFTLPTGLPLVAKYSLAVSANGISSDSIPFTPTGSVAVNEDATRNGMDAFRLQDFIAVLSGSTLSIHFRLSAGAFDGNDGKPLTMQLAGVDGKIMDQEKLSGAGEFDRQIDFGKRGKGIYLFILKQDGNQLAGRIIVP